MCHLEGAKLEEPEDVHFYESFTYGGVDYSLYDSVFIHVECELAPYIGKLVRIWEEADKSKKIKVQWFFRPSEISYYLRDAEVLENELFFASGCGIGLVNINPLEAIAGKCNVVCISTDKRNPQPSAEEVQMANYVFYRIFDVRSCTISDQLHCTVGMLPVEFVFNRKESERRLNIPKFDLKRKYDARNTFVCKETRKLACKSSPEQLRSLKLNENCNLMMEEEDAEVRQLKAKKESLPGQTKKGSLIKESTRGRKCSSVDVNSSKDTEAISTIEKKSALGANVGCKVNVEKDKVKDMMSPVNQVHIEERVKFARISNDFGDKSFKRANLVTTSLKVKCPNDVHSLTISGIDAVPLLTGATSCDAKSKSELVQNCGEPGKDERLSKARDTSFNETPKSEHIADVGLEKFAKLSKDLNALEEKLSKTNVIPSSEKPKSGHAKKCVGPQKDLKLAKSLSACREKPSMSNDVLVNETSKFGIKEDFGGLGQLAKFVEDSSALGKRSIKTCAYPSNWKPNHGHDARYEREDVTLAKYSCPREEGPSKKAKLDDYIKTFEENNNDALQKLKEKSRASDLKNSSMVSVSLNDYKLKSRFAKHSGELGKGRSKEYYNYDMGKLLGGNLSKLSVPTSKGDNRKVEGQIFEVTPRPIIEKSKWLKLKELSWEGSVKTAHEEGTLVLLQNLDPGLTSVEVQDIVWHAFNEYCMARMVQHTAISNPHYGQAIVIFSTSEVAERVVKKLDDECLMLLNQRPLVGCTVVLPELPGKQTAFVGHLSIDKVRRQIQREMKEAVSTSHYSQTNTIEYEMAMEWCLLQSKSDIWWQNLFELQKEKLKKLTANLKSKCTSTAI